MMTTPMCGVLLHSHWPGSLITVRIIRRSSYLCSNERIAEFRDTVSGAIPRIIALLHNDETNVKDAARSALAKFTEHSEHF